MCVWFECKTIILELERLLLLTIMIKCRTSLLLQNTNTAHIWWVIIVHIYIGGPVTSTDTDWIRRKLFWLIEKAYWVEYNALMTWCHKREGRDEVAAEGCRKWMMSSSSHRIVMYLERSSRVIPLSSFLPCVCPTWTRSHGPTTMAIEAPSTQTAFSFPVHVLNLNYSLLAFTRKSYLAPHSEWRRLQNINQDELLQYELHIAL